jgi:predicted nucleotidyltransferase
VLAERIVGHDAIMRLSDAHRQAVLRVVAEHCGPAARVRLFGSRLDDSRRGGDVDLLVELPTEPDDLPALQRQLYVKLLRALDGRPVDVFVLGPHSLHRPLHEQALREGVLL